MILHTNDNLSVRTLKFNKKMKAIKYLFLLSFIYTAFSCIDDLGNYEYVTKEKILPISISGFNDTTMLIGNELNIIPEIYNMDNENRYVYLWYVSKSVTAGVLPKRDTLSLERNLSEQIKMEADLYNLVFEIRDPKLDIYVSKKVILDVKAGDISTGWYILKDIDNETDFDYIPLDSTVVISNVLKDRAGLQQYVNGSVVIGNQQLKGKAVKMIWQGTRYYHQVENENGIVTMLANQKVLHILSENDFKTFNSDNLYLFKNLSDEFYDTPQIINLQNIAFQMTDLYLNNSIGAHSIYGMSLNAGRFSYAKTCGFSPNYRLHSDMLAGMFGSIFYDTVTNSFLITSAVGATLDKLAEPINLQFPSTTNMDYELIRMLERENNSFTRNAYCIFKNQSSGKYYLAYMSTITNSAYPFISFKEIQDGAKLPKADVMSVPQYASCVYFGKENVLSYYLDASDIEDNEKIIKTFPINETIAYIGNPKKEILLVLTNSSNGWKLYGFPIIGVTPDIKVEPEIEYSGEGNGRYVMFRSI